MSYSPFRSHVCTCEGGYPSLDVSPSPLREVGYLHHHSPEEKDPPSPPGGYRSIDLTPAAK